MEALHMQGHALSLRPLSQFQPNTDQIRRNLIKKGVNPTPKIVHNLRKKQIQKHNRKLNRQAQESPPLSKTQQQTLEEEQHFQELKYEYKQFTKALEGNSEEDKGLCLVGKPWEGVQKVGFLERTREFRGEKLKRESLMELKEMLRARKMDELKWVLEDDLEINEAWFDESSDGKKSSKRSEVQVVRFLVDRLCDREIGAKDWKFSRLMKLSGLPFTEGQLLMILEMLGVRACWKQALSVVQWVYDCKDRKKFQSRFVYTKLLAVLGKARRPKEALQIFNFMRGNVHVYPDMAAYHSIAVTLGQAGLLKELLNIVECMRQKPETFKYMYRKNWDPSLEPDVVIYNAVLNACVPSKQWKGVSWVFQQLRESGLKPNGATYGLAMEVMLQSGKYDLVHELFRKMSSVEVPEALTYKVLVRTFWKEGKVDEAVKVVRDMERRGVMGTASVYYELACCLCNCGRWQDAIPEVEKIRRLPHARPVEVTFTGMIRSSMDGGHIDDCVSIFEFMKDHCAPNVGTVNTMLKAYSQNDMFSKAKVLFEEVKDAKSDLRPNAYTYNLILEASARAHQWEYFEHVYKEMILSSYHLDQNKHLTLLLKASRAGKLHLLEHAFDMILEAGEIPHHLFFFELVIQAMTRDNYERAVVLLSSMAYAPYRVTEKQWTELFKENKDRIDHENLELLLDSLGNCSVVSEATVSNLFKSLRVLCGLGSSTNTSSIIHFGSENVDGLKETIDGGGNGSLPNIFGRVTIESAESGNDIFLGSDQVEPDAFTFNHDQVDRVNNNDVVVSRSHNSDTEDNISLHADRFNSSDHLAHNKSSDDELSDDESDEDDDVGEGVINKPSAYQILEAWKEMREVDRSLLDSEIICG